MDQPVAVREPSAAGSTVSEFETIFRIAPIGLAILDRELRYVRCNDRLAHINGIPADDHIGRTVRELLPAVAEVVEPEFRNALETGEPHHEFRVTAETPKAPGQTRSWLECIQPITDGSGIAHHILVSVQEITSLEDAESALRESERILRASQQLSPVAFTILRAVRDEDGSVVDFVWEYANPAATAALGAQPLEGQRLLDLLPGNRDHPQLFPRYVRALQSPEPDEAEVRYESDGIECWFLNSVVCIDADRIASSFKDVSDRKKTEQELDIVTREFKHRVKNTIAVVQGLIRGTATDSGTAAELADKVCERLAAMSAAQDLLSNVPDHQVALDVVIETALAAYRVPQLRLRPGPSVSVPSAAVMPLTLALNELATNALKHGSLSRRDGHVDISWRNGNGRTELTWEEPGVILPDGGGKAGFGSRLIASVAKSLPAGEVERTFTPEGFRARIAFAPAD